MEALYCSVLVCSVSSISSSCAARALDTDSGSFFAQQRRRIFGIRRVAVRHGDGIARREKREGKDGMFDLFFETLCVQCVLTSQYLWLLFLLLRKMTFSGFVRIPDERSGGKRLYR